MALEKRFSDYETMGELFSEMKDDLMALTLWKRVLACIERLLDVLAERYIFRSIPVQHFGCAVSTTKG